MPDSHDASKYWQVAQQKIKTVERFRQAIRR